MEGLKKALEGAVERPEGIAPQEVQDIAHRSLVELSRLTGLLKDHGIDPNSEFICGCGLRRSPMADDDPLF